MGLIDDVHKTFVSYDVRSFAMEKVLEAMFTMHIIDDDHQQVHS